MQNPVFTQRYQNLNTQQKKAVDCIDGPVMVVAGPGTGKTEILAARICNILNETQVDASNILCLTYTDAGVRAMRTRLQVFLNEDAYKVNIHTFHSFCSHILDKHAWAFNNKRFSIVDDLEKAKALETIFSNLPPSNEWYKGNLTNVDAYISDNNKPNFDSIFKEIEENRLQKEVLEEKIADLSIIENFCKAFPEFTYKKNPDKVIKPVYEKLTKNWKKAVDAFEIHQHYIEWKQKHAYADYTDLLLWVSEALENNGDLLQIIQEQFQYVLVDEFQDTNPLQASILYKIMSFYEDNPNCFVVGDDDQSIYSFQGADVGNMINFYTKYKNFVQVISLENNYRSSQPLLNFAANYIKLNTDRLVNEIPNLSKKFSALGTFKDATFTPELQMFNTNEAQFLHIAVSIDKLLKNGTNPNEIAIIAKKNIILTNLAMILKANQVPFVLQRKINILEEPIIKEILNWLLFIQKECLNVGSGALDLFKLLHTTNLPTLDIQLLFAESTYKNKNEKSTQVLQSLLSTESNTLDAFKPTMAPMAKNIVELIKKYNTCSIVDLVHSVFINCEYIKRAQNGTNARHDMDVLLTFLKFIEDCSRLFPQKDNSFYINRLFEMKALNIVIPLRISLNNQNGVQLLSMHGCKGLEFEHVFICNVDSSFKNVNNSFKMGKAVHYLFNNAIVNLNYSETNETMFEERRLWYVAITRAKKGLYFTGSLEKKGYENVMELFNTSQIIHGTVSPELELKQLANNLIAKDSYLIPSNDNWLKDKIDNFVFSHTSLVSILNCEFEFYLYYLLKIPTSSNINMVYGSAIHYAISKLIIEWKEKIEDIGLHGLINYFKQQLSWNRGLVSIADFELKLKQGEIVLTTYYNSQFNTIKQAPNILSEEKITTQLYGVPLTANIDKIEFLKDPYTNNNCIISDFKTGMFNSAVNKFKPSKKTDISTINIKDKEYWIQGLLYWQVLKAKYPNWNVTQINLEILNATNLQGEVLSYIPTQKDADLVKQLVLKGKEQLMSTTFPKKCKNNKCEYCSYFTSYNLPKNEEE